MPDNMINVDPRERLKFGEKLIAFEEQMKAAAQSVRNRLNEAEGHLQDPGSKFYIAEGINLVDSIEALLDGGITEAGAVHKGKALDQIRLMEEFAGKLDK